MAGRPAAIGRRIVRAVIKAGAGLPRNWADIFRPVLRTPGVHTGWMRERGGEDQMTVELMTVELISKAQDGDGDAFRALTEPYRRELPGALLPPPRIGARRRGHAAGRLLTAAWRGLADFSSRAHRSGPGSTGSRPTVPLNAIRSRARHPRGPARCRICRQPAGTYADRRCTVARPVPGICCFPGPPPTMLPGWMLRSRQREAVGVWPSPSWRPRCRRPGSARRSCCATRSALPAIEVAVDARHRTGRFGDQRAQAGAGEPQSRQTTLAADPPAPAAGLTLRERQIASRFTSVLPRERRPSAASWRC